MMKRTVFIILLFVTVVFLVDVPNACFAKSADNTGINKQDQSQEKLTADQQGETKNDREITRQIRRAVIADKSLSTNAHNVKIITVGGIVTLKGPVRSEEEKNSIEEKAAGIVGKTNIKNEIGIAPKKTDK
jgi:hyperosmotically inducible protein